MTLKRYNIEYEDQKGIIRNTIVTAKCKEKATETFFNLKAARIPPYRF